MREPLVSIITPCFNGENYVARYFDSILNQTYKNIELIFVNDGSTDSTEKIANSYIKKFENMGIKFIYIYQENKGLGGAINTGLKKVSGEYFIWPDSDDFLRSDSIQLRVEFLEKNIDYAFVRSDANMFNENDLTNPIGVVSLNKKNRFNDKLFEDLLIANTFCTPGCYMVRTSSFLTVNPQKDIYESREGQNGQLLYPLSYNYRCGYIDLPLYSYVVRGESLSHSPISYEKTLKRLDEYFMIFYKTMDPIFYVQEDRNFYINMMKCLITRQKLSIAVKQKDKKVIIDCVINLVRYGKITKGDIVSVLRYYKGFKTLFDFYFKQKKSRGIYER